MKNIFVLFFIILLFIYSSFIEPNWLIYKNQNIYTQNWDKNLDGYKIAVISDLHIGTGNIDCNKIDKITERVNNESPDLIVLLGDFDAKYIEYSKISEQDISDSLSKLKAKYGVYAILGNHDYEPPYIVNRILENSNIQLLENESGKLMISKETIENLVNSVAKGFESTEDVTTRVELDKDNNVRVYANLVVSSEAVIKDLSAKLQTSVKDKIKKATDLEVNEVNITVRKVADKPQEI